MKRKLLVVAFFAASFLSAAPQTQFPDTPAAHQFSAWLDAFNSGDRATLLEFLQKNNPARAEEIDGAIRFRQMTGGFDFKKAEESTSSRFRGIVKERDSDTFVVAVLANLDPPAAQRVSDFVLNRLPEK